MEEQLAVKQSIPDSENVAGASLLGEIADTLNRPEVLRLLDVVVDRADDFVKLAERIARMESDGRMERVDQLLSMVNAVLDAVTPEIVAGLAKTGGRVLEMGDVLLNSELGQRLPEVLQGIESVISQPQPHRPKRGSVRQLVAVMRDPDLQMGAAVALELLRHFAQDCERRRMPEPVADGEA